jgi:hypothetical protein
MNLAPLKFLLIFTFLGAASAQEPKSLPIDFDLRGKGILLQVTEAVPVFSRPDPRSAKLADAEVGTVLLAIVLSNKRTWVQVEDDIGTNGWVPVERTDLGELLAAQLKIQQAQLEATREALEARSSESRDSGDIGGGAVYQSTNQIRHVLGPVFQFAPQNAWGFLYSVLFEFYLPSKGGIRQRGFGGEAAWYRDQSEYFYEFRVRYSSKFSKRPSFSSGPDIAIRFGGVSSPNVFMAGYRIGYDFGGRYPLELRAALTSQRGSRFLSDVSWRVRF